MKTACIIPVRMASTRFPGKPLAKIFGHSMTEHVFRRVQMAEHIDEVYVATCDREIAEEVERFGGQVVMTSANHTRGTGRVAEAAGKIEADIIINVQGDEPLVDPVSLDKALIYMYSSKDIDCINLVSTIIDWNVFVDPNVVKTVVDEKGRVLYFSREAIPHMIKERFTKGLKQIGIYYFQKDLILKYDAWDETALEQQEGIDMLRILENGYDIHAFESKDMISVDTPAELKEMERLLAKDELCRQIFSEKVSK